MTSPKTAASKGELSIRIGWYDSMKGQWRSRYFHGFSGKIWNSADEEELVEESEKDDKTPRLVVEITNPEELVDNQDYADLMLAKRVLDGDNDGVWPLIDELLMSRERTTKFQTRSELLEIIRLMEYGRLTGNRACQACSSYNPSHRPTCKILRALDEFEKYRNKEGEWSPPEEKT